jgi:hypothetical protein
MQPAKLTASRNAWASVTSPLELDALDEPGELEAHAAIATAAAIAAAAGSADLSLNMTQVLSGRGSHECNTPAPGGGQPSAIGSCDGVTRSVRDVWVRVQVAKDHWRSAPTTRLASQTTSSDQPTEDW